MTTRELFRMWRKSMWESGYRHASNVDQVAASICFAYSTPPMTYVGFWSAVIDPSDTMARIDALFLAESRLSESIREECGRLTPAEQYQLNRISKMKDLLE